MDNSRTLMWIALLLAAVLLTGCAVTTVASLLWSRRKGASTDEPAT